MGPFLRQKQQNKESFMNDKNLCQSGIKVKRLLPPEQRAALESVAQRFNTELNWNMVVLGGSGLPSDWVLCQIGPIVVGVSPAGDVHS
jgi:hypothetical protein